MKKKLVTEIETRLETLRDDKEVPSHKHIDSPEEGGIYELSRLKKLIENNHISEKPKDVRSKDMLLSPLTVQGVENIEIGADGEIFELFLESEEPEGVKLELTSEEREAIHNVFNVIDDRAEGDTE